MACATMMPPDSACSSPRSSRFCSPSAAFGLEEEDAAPIRTRLAAVLRRAQLERCFDAALSWCEEEGAVTIDEIAENFEDFTEGLKLKKLEKKRLFRLVTGLGMTDGYSKADTMSVCSERSMFSAFMEQDMPADADSLDMALAMGSQQPFSSDRWEARGASSSSFLRVAPVQREELPSSSSEKQPVYSQTPAVPSADDLTYVHDPEKEDDEDASCAALLEGCSAIELVARPKQPKQLPPLSLERQPARLFTPPSRSLLNRAPRSSSIPFPGPSKAKSHKGMISECPLFTGLADSALESINSALRVEASRAVDSFVFQHGAEANCMYFILEGEIEIRTATGASLTTIRQGGFFGELGVLFAGKRTAAAVVSSGPCKLAALHRPDLVKVSCANSFQQELFDRGQGLPHVRNWFVRQLPLFARCDSVPGFVDRVAEALEIKKALGGEVLIREGNEGREMFFIFDGSVSITKRGGRAPIRVNAPSFFGELALLYSEPRSATVTCTAQCRLYVLQQEALHRILQEFPPAIGAMYSSAQETASLKAHFIKKIPLFQSMAANEEFIANISMALESVSAEPGEHLVRQGEASDGRMYAIAHGHAEVLKIKQAGCAPVIAATLKPGAFFGEVALLLDTPRLASVVARGHCHVYTLSRDAFETLAVVYSQWWKELMSEQGLLLKQIKASGLGIGADVTTRTHGLHIPQVAGKSASSMLAAAEAPPADTSSIPDGRLCLVCRSAEKSILSVPCGHVTACAECHEPLKSCPLCRTAIDGGHRAFF